MFRFWPTKDQIAFKRARIQFNKGKIAEAEASISSIADPAGLHGFSDLQTKIIQASTPAFAPEEYDDVNSESDDERYRRYEEEDSGYGVRPDRGFAGYADVHEWRAATFGGVDGVRSTWNPTRKGGFGGYASKADWSRATFGNGPRR